MKNQIWVIAIVGGSGSGKTTLAKKLRRLLSHQDCAILGQDSYYKDQSAQFDHDGGLVNFDHPQALEFSLMAAHIQQLKLGQDIQIPVYDFASHSRLKKTQTIKS